MDRGVIATAKELFDARHFPSVVAMVTDALEDEPECVPLLLVRARAHIALRRDLDAQGDLRDVIRLDARCGLAYRLLGELAARRDENESAAIFFREAVRLDPDDREARDWLSIVDASLRPIAVARHAAGRFPITPTKFERPKSEPPRTLSSPARRASSPQLTARLARGTYPPSQDDEQPTDRAPMELEGEAVERVTQPFPRGSTPLPPPRVAPAVWKTPEPVRSVAPPVVQHPTTFTGRPATQPPAKQAPRITQRPITRGPTPELPGFGDYLVTSGILTRERLRAAQAYQRSMKVQLATAIVTLGLATPQRIEWAAVSHQSELARERQQQG